MRSLHARRLVSFGLLGVAALMVGLLYFTTDSVGTRERTARSNHLLLVFIEDELERIQFEPGGEPGFSLERTRDEQDHRLFRIAPLGETAESSAVDRLLRALESATIVRRIPASDKEQKEYGLTRPSLRLRLLMGAIGYELSFGGHAVSPSGARYVEVLARGADDEKIAVLDQATAQALSPALDELRSPELLRHSPRELESVVLRGTGGTRTLRNDPGVGFRFQGTAQDRLVDPEALDVLLVQVTRLSLSSLLPFDRAAVIVSAAKSSVTLELKAGERRTTIELGGACPTTEDQIVAIRRDPYPIAGCVPSTVLPGLTQTAEELVLKSAFSFSPDEVESLDARVGERQLELVRTGSSFLMRKPIRAPVPLAPGNEYLTAIVRTRGSFVEELEKGLDDWAGRITLRSVAESESTVRQQSVLVSRTLPDGRRLVQREADGAVLSFDEESAQLFVPDPEALAAKANEDSAEADPPAEGQDGR